MRIGFDATALPPKPVGAGNYILELVRALALQETEHEFIVFAQKVGRELIGDLQSPRFNWVILPDKSPFRRLLWEQTVFPFLVRESGVDLLHSPHYTRPFYLPCASVVTFHDMTFFLYPELHTRSKRLFFPLTIRVSARRADMLIADSENTRRDALRILGISPDKIVTVPLGVSEAFRQINEAKALEECRRKYGLPEQFILYVGAVEPRKNLPLLIRAYKQLLALEKAAPPIVIVGKLGWNYKEVFQLIETLDLKDKVIFTGYLPSQDLPLVYNLAEYLVYPSKYEGFGFPPLEAMACGTPVITTAVSSMPAHIGEAGILIPAGDEPALLRAMHELLNNKDLRDDLSEKGRQQAASFTWRHTALETLKVYQKLGDLR